jgi:AcrR family transcriptional regulator
MDEVPGMTDRGKATRARLIEATRSVVREVGYAHASTRAIAQAAGVAEGTIYRHFPDKASLFFATVLEANAPIVEWMASLPGRAGQSSVEGNLTDAVIQLAGLRHDVIPLEMAIASDPELSAQRRHALAAAGGTLPPGPPEAVGVYLAAEQELGRVRAEVDPHEAARLILGFLFSIAVMPTVEEAVIDPNRLASAVRIFVHGIGPASRGPETA